LVTYTYVHVILIHFQECSLEGQGVLSKSVVKYVEPKLRQSITYIQLEEVFHMYIFICIF